ncbi:unnamed protein product [Lactuca saligna]|uniref:Protein kinase domain-containing protein n=1 Tax=Lactuca saligna TaxID=75948 RepID=A0AA36A478_LACSI|nr:unnamed protein product [Lactuca saligna]
MWMQRLKICLGAAMGLSHLHDPHGTQQRVIHRDIKSANILLDGNWNTKVSDMGLSKIGPANQSQSFLATNVVGTPIYVDPMYVETGILTKESDVYSFEVVLFEVLCGTQDMNMRSQEIFSEIMYQCLLRSCSKRSKMSQVVEKLELALQFQQGISNPEEFKELVKSSMANEKEYKWQHVVLLK